jgi:hypothetical protein
MRIALRATVTVIAFLLLVMLEVWLADTLFGWANARCSPIMGEPSTDPCGRGSTASADIFGIGFFICILLGGVGAWLVWMLTDKRNWLTDLLIGTPVFLLFAAITADNYIRRDTVFTADSQAALNFLLVASGVAVVIVLQGSLKRTASKFAFVLGTLTLGFCVFAFIATPLWYTLSFLSWKMGSGKLNSFNDAADALSGAAALLCMLGIVWKKGYLSFDKKSLKNPTSSKRRLSNCGE